jgi:hypothetical protein
VSWDLTQPDLTCILTARQTNPRLLYGALCRVVNDPQAPRVLCIDIVCRKPATQHAHLLVVCAALAKTFPGSVAMDGGLLHAIVPIIVLLTWTLGRSLGFHQWRPFGTRMCLWPLDISLFGYFASPQLGAVGGSIGRCCATNSPTSPDDHHRHRCPAGGCPGDCPVLRLHRDEC